MVSADNLNLDCLELVFAHLSGNDLFSVSLVSKSFLAGVVPFLYRTLAYHLGNAKRYPAVLTPFEVLVDHPSLAVHVQAIDIRTVPLVKSAIHPKFMASLIASMRLCINLRTFTCTPNILPALLLPLNEHQDLQGVRLSATLTVQQAKLLTSLTKLKSLALDACSWNMVDTMPDWTRNISRTLTSLVFYTIQELNECILEDVLLQLPGLTSLNVVGCAKIEHVSILRATRHTPKLQSLALTAWDSATLPPDLRGLPHLRHIAVDTHVGPPMGDGQAHSSPSLWPEIIDLTKSWHCALTSITLRLSEKTPVSHSFVEKLLGAHSSTLEHVALINVDVLWESVRAIAVKCKRLDRLAIHIPNRDVRSFSTALAHSKTLQMLTDIGESHAVHSSQAFLSRDNVKTMMIQVPNLKKLVTIDRIWTCDKIGEGWRVGSVQLKLEKRKNSCPQYWFLPR